MPLFFNCHLPWFQLFWFFYLRQETSLVGGFPGNVRDVRLRFNVLFIKPGYYLSNSFDKPRHREEVNNFASSNYSCLLRVCYLQNCNKSFSVSFSWVVKIQDFFEKVFRFNHIELPVFIFVTQEKVIGQVDLSFGLSFANSLWQSLLVGGENGGKQSIH